MKKQNKLDHPYTKNPLDSPEMSPLPVREHQRAIGDFLFAIDPILEIASKYEVLPEIELGGPNTKAPDVVVCQLSDEKPVMFIEVCSQEGLKYALKMVPRAVRIYKSVQEAFIYNYDRNEFYRLDRSLQLEHNVSYSRVIDLDLKVAFQDSTNG